MDSERFDELVRRVGATRFTRGHALRGLVGGALAAVLGTALAADGADARNRKKKRGRDTSKGRSQVRAQVQGDKVAICHFTHDPENPYNIIDVSPNSVQEQSHLSHGDHYYADKDPCCIDSDCSHLTDECRVGTCVVNRENVGVCQSVPTPEGTHCGDGRVCDGQGICGTGPDPECIGATCNTFIPCSGSNLDCVCTTTATGGGFCVPGSTQCADLVHCDADFGCPDGSLCAVDTCCVNPVCVPLELTCSGDAAARSRSTAPDGPTIARR